MPIILEASGLNKRYAAGDQEAEVIRNVEFRVQKGEFASILGPSGSGKSTLLQMLGGLVKPTSGEIHLAGKRLTVMNDRENTLFRRMNVGFVFQFYNLVPTLSVEENILLPVILDNQDTRRYADRLDRLLRLVGLTLRRKQKPGQLSEGEQQRAALARALITQPAVVLADEPTGNFDSKTGAAMLEMLRRACDELEQTIVLATHDPSAAVYADQVIFLKDGQVAALLDLQTVGFAERLNPLLTTVEQLGI